MPISVEPLSSCFPISKGCCLLWGPLPVGIFHSDPQLTRPSQRDAGLRFSESWSFNARPPFKWMDELARLRAQLALCCIERCSVVCMVNKKYIHVAALGSRWGWFLYNLQLSEKLFIKKPYWYCNWNIPSWQPLSIYIKSQNFVNSASIDSGNVETQPYQILHGSVTSEPNIYIIESGNYLELYWGLPGIYRATVYSIKNSLPDVPREFLFSVSFQFTV